MSLEKYKETIEKFDYNGLQEELSSLREIQLNGMSAYKNEIRYKINLILSILEEKE